MQHLTSGTSSLSSIYPTLSLSCLSELSFPSCSVHTPGSHLLLPYFHPPLYITLSLSLSLFATLLYTTPSPLVSLYSSLLLISTTHSLLLSVSHSLSHCGSPAGHFCPVCPLWENNSLWEAGGGGWPCEEGSGSVIKVTLSAERESWGDKGEEGRKRVERWVQGHSHE